MIVLFKPIHYILLIFQVVEIIGGQNDMFAPTPPPNIFIRGGGGRESTGYIFLYHSYSLVRALRSKTVLRSLFWGL